jgi:hypothetical protein
MEDEKLLKEINRIKQEIYKKSTYGKVLEEIKHGDIPVELSITVGSRRCDFELHPWDKEKVIELLEFRYKLSEQTIRTSTENVNMILNLSTNMGN